MASCTSCGTQSPDVARFCMGCGARLPDAQPVAPPLAATGPRQERKVVTVLFADLAGFTTRSEGADPEDVRALVRPFHAVLRREVDSFGGTLARIVGDAGLAVFGYPAAHEDDAERAVRAGLAILAGLERLNADTPGLDLHARVGVNTGEAVVTYGDPAEDADDLMGEAVNAAQRLQATAPVDGLVIGEATHAAAGSRFGLAALDDVAAKGLTAPLRRWRVLGPAVEIGAAPPQPSPFVGREDALALLERELHAVRDGRTVRLVTVLGEPGIGKGRLIAEFERRHAAEAAWRHGDTPAYGEALAFRALADIVRAEVGIRDSDTRGQAQRRLLSRLAGLVAEPLERRWLASHVAALLRLGPAPSGGREEAFAAWGRFLERIAGDASVLVLDDLHWADDGLLDFVEHLVAHPGRAPLLVIAIARSELRDRRPAWGRAASHHSVIELSPLSAEEMAALLREMMRDLPDGLASRIEERAAGVPLFAVEILRMLADRGEAVPEGDRYRLLGDPGDVAVPPGLFALVASRVDALRSDERLLLRQASVLGDRFPIDALAAVAGVAAPSLEPLLGRLAVHGVLAAAADGEEPHARRRLAFSHALVREVAYGTLARHDRQAMHLAAADYWAGLGDQEQVPGQVASHVLAAYRAVPTGSAEPALRARVVEALRTAAERAMSVHSAEAAVGFLDEALGVATEPGDLAELHLRKARAAQAAGDLNVAAGHAREALERFRALGDRPGLARTAAALGSIQTEQYDDAAVATLEQAMAEVRAGPDDADGDETADPATVELLAGLARAYIVNGRRADAEAVAERAVRHAERAGLVEFAAEGMAAKGAALLEDCRIPQGSALLWASVELAERHGFIATALRARSSLAVGLLTGDPAEAEAMARGGLATAGRIGLRGLEVRIASNWADAAIETGRWDDLDTVLAPLDSPDLPTVDRVDLLSVGLMVRALRGDPSALPALTGLWEAIPGEDAPFAELSLDTRRAWALLAGGRPADALADAEKAIRAGLLYGRRGALYAGVIPAAHAALWSGDADRLAALLGDLRDSGLDGGWCRLVIGSLEAGLAALRGEMDRAAAGYDRARSAWRGTAPFSVGLAELEAARLLPTGTPQADLAAAEARRVLSGLGAGALLDRLANGLSAGA